MTSSFDVGSSSGTSNSVINGVHNGAVQDGYKVAIGSTIDQNSDVQETNLGDCANGTAEVQTLVEGSEYVGHKNTDNATSLEDEADYFFANIGELPGMPMTFLLAEQRAGWALLRDYDCVNKTDEVMKCY